MAMLQLFPAVDLKKLTSWFIIVEKLSVEALVFDKCEGMNAVQFKLKTVESYDVVPRFIVLAAESTMAVEWKHSAPAVKLADMRITVDGITTVGKFM